MGRTTKKRFFSKNNFRDPTSSPVPNTDASTRCMLHFSQVKIIHMFQLYCTIRQYMEHNSPKALGRLRTRNIVARHHTSIAEPHFPEYNSWSKVTLVFKRVEVMDLLHLAV